MNDAFKPGPVLTKGAYAVNVYSGDNTHDVTESVIATVARIGERAYGSPPWNRVGYSACRQCGGIYFEHPSMGDMHNPRTRTCTFCKHDLVLVPHRLSDYFELELSYVLDKASTNEAVLFLAWANGSPVASRSAISLNLVAREGSHQAAAAVTEIAGSVDLDPKDLEYTIDTFVDPHCSNRGVGSLLVEAHIENARHRGSRGLVGWTQSNNAALINLLTQQGYVALPADIHAGLAYDPHTAFQRFRLSSTNTSDAAYFIRHLG